QVAMQPGELDIIEERGGLDGDGEVQLAGAESHDLPVPFLRIQMKARLWETLLDLADGQVRAVTIDSGVGDVQADVRHRVACQGVEHVARVAQAKAAADIHDREWVAARQGPDGPP